MRGTIRRVIESGAIVNPHTRGVIGALLLLAVADAWPLSADTRQACSPPAMPNREPTMFTEAQENELGDVVYEHVRRDFYVVDDDVLSAKLREMGARLLGHLPPTELRVQFFIVESDEVNAFVLPGGRIFVSRKLIGFTEREDELAGVIAHELGHLVSRQQSAATSRALKNALGVTALDSRADIAELYHRLLDNAARNRTRPPRSHEGEEQIVADRIGLFALAAAGYDGDAFVAFYDRLAQTKGRTGSFFSDLFFSTPPEAKRLRELLQAAKALPATCRSRPATDQAAYAEWKKSVAAADVERRTEVVPGVTSRVELAPKLRGELTHVKFSPDGRRILAQDDGGIVVLTREPFAAAFRIDTPSLVPAQFTPDGARLAFLTDEFRVEFWSLAARRREQIHDVFMRDACLHAALAPDGATLACIDRASTLTLVDVETGASIYQRTNFYRRSIGESLARILSGRAAVDPNPIRMDFSTDGAYFVAGYHQIGGFAFEPQANEFAVAYDVRRRSVIELKRSVARLVTGDFAFIGPERLIGQNWTDGTRSGVVTLPAGEVSSPMSLPPGALSAATRGGYLFVRPFQKYAVGVVDIDRQQIVKGLDVPAVDIYDDVFVAERGDGSLGLYATADNRLLGSAALPGGALGAAGTRTISEDFRFLALSNHARGAVWDLTDGRSVGAVRGFLGASLTADGVLTAHFPAQGPDKEKIARVDVARRQGGPVLEARPGETLVQVGTTLLRFNVPAGRQSRVPVEFEVYEPAESRTPWRRTLDGQGPVEISVTQDHLVVGWPANSKTAQEAVARNPTLRRQFDALEERSGDVFLEVLNLRDGSAQGGMFVETQNGSFQVDHVLLATDVVVLQDSSRRTRIYEHATGRINGRVFGTARAVSSAGVMAVHNGPGRLVLTEATTLARRGELRFAHEISFVRFSADGRRLFVLTADQTAYTVAVPER